MKPNVKNISALIIIICVLSIIIGLFLPKENNKATLLQAKYESNRSFALSNISHIQFKGEHITAIKLEGIISDASGASILRDITSSNAVLDELKKAIKDPTVKAIILRINSPGGTVAASQELYETILKAKRKKPVVVTMGDIAASGGYYIASAADVIYANPGTLTGSIGVITSYLNFQEFLNKIGIKGVVIKSGEFKDIGNPTRQLTEQERKILQSLLDDTYNQFIHDVAKGRKLPLDKIKKLARGLIYTGRQAKQAGLVDHLGDYNKALKHAQILAKERFPELARRYGDRDLPVEEKWKTTSIIDVLFGATNRIMPESKINEIIFKQYSYSKFQPLWLLE